jgi:hypothetical protein
MRNTVALVLQGPWSRQWLNKLDHYLEVFQEIIISTYQDPDLARFMDQPQFSQVKVIINDDLIPPFHHNHKNLFYQGKTTINGAKAATSEFVVKGRLDEFYSNMGLVRAMLLAMPHKIHSLNVFFRHIYNEPYHMGDHLIATRRDWMINGMDHLLSFCLDTKENKSIIERSPEFAITLSMLMAASVDLFNGTIADHMRTISIIPVQHLHPFSIKCQNERYHTIEGYIFGNNGMNLMHETIEEYLT